MIILILSIILEILGATIFLKSIDIIPTEGKETLLAKSQEEISWVAILFCSFADGIGIDRFSFMLIFSVATSILYHKNWVYYEKFI